MESNSLKKQTSQLEKNHTQSDNESNDEEIRSMSYIYYLSVITPHPQDTDPLTQYLQGTFKQENIALIPEKLGRITWFPTHAQEYLSLINPSSTSTKLPKIHHNKSFSLDKSVSRFSTINYEKISAYTPGVVRVFKHKKESVDLISSVRKRLLYTPDHLYRMSPVDKSSIRSPSTEPPLSIRYPSIQPPRQEREGNLHSKKPEFSTGKSSSKFRYSKMSPLKKGGKTEKKLEETQSYTGEKTNGLRSGFGEQKYPEIGLVYKGEWNIGTRHGQGELVFENKDKIKGTWEEGKIKENRVKIKYNNGLFYDGQVKNTLRHGLGTQFYPQGHYKGPWANDKREGIGAIDHPLFFFEGLFKQDTTDGEGILVLKDVFNESSEPSERYISIEDLIDCLENYSYIKQAEFASTDLIYQSLTFESVKEKVDVPSGVILENGAFRGGKLTGAGLARYSSYGIYIGNFVEGVRDGWGKMVYTDPSYFCRWSHESEGEYSGYWKNNSRNGHGLMIWPNNMKYEGYFKEDQRHQVTGIMWFMTGEIYDGGWSNNMMEGFGSLTNTEGITYKTEFNRGKAENKGVLELSVGKYRGEVSMFEPNGVGKMRFDTGNVFSGRFKRGVIVGPGKMEYRNGDVYDGEWKEGERHGEGRMVYKGRREVYFGSWKENKRHGEGRLSRDDGTVMYEGIWNDDKRT